MVRSLVACLARNAISLSLILRNCAVCFTSHDRCRSCIQRTPRWMRRAVRRAEPKIKVGFECNETSPSSSSSIATIPTLHVWCVSVRLCANVSQLIGLCFYACGAPSLHLSVVDFLRFSANGTQRLYPPWHRSQPSAFTANDSFFFANYGFVSCSFVIAVPFIQMCVLGRV